MSKRAYADNSQVYQNKAPAKTNNLELHLTAQHLEKIPIRLNLIPCDLAARHLGIITINAKHWYPFIPPSTRAFYDLEDMVADVALHVQRRMQRYQYLKARGSTWVYRIAQNRCRDIVQYYQRGRRNAICVDIELPSVSGQLQQESVLRKRLAVNAVERVIESSSDAAKDLIECLLSGNFSCLERIPAHALAATKELQETAREQHATAEDFLLVYRHAC